MITFFISFLLSLISYVITDSVSVSVIFVLYFSIGSLVTKALSRKPHIEISNNIFSVSFFAYFIYALLCYMYMKANDFHYMQSVDGFEVYIPYTVSLLHVKSFYELVDTIYSTSYYSFVGSILILFVYTGKLSQLFDGELYLTIQISIIIFAAWVPVVIFRMLVQSGISNRKSYQYTLIYSLLSIHFMMAVLIVRDMPITLFYVLIIFLSFKKYSTKNVIYIILLILLTMSLRISSGIFAMLYLLIVMFLNRSTSNGKLSGKTISMMFFFGVVLIVGVMFFNTALDVFLRKQEGYSQQELLDQGGESTKALFNILPPVVSEFAKSVYNQVMPIPSWRKMIRTNFRPEVYNVMNFPEIGAVLFSYWMWGFILLGMIDTRIRRTVISNKVLLYNVLIAAVFLMLQADTLGHRRMLGVYPVFFLLFCLIYEKLEVRNKRTGYFVIFGFFLFVQLLGFLYIKS